MIKIIKLKKMFNCDSMILIKLKHMFMVTKRYLTTSWAWQSLPATMCLDIAERVREDHVDSCHPELQQLAQSSDVMIKIIKQMFNCDNIVFIQLEQIIICDNIHCFRFA